ncbi:hypothetical protein [Haladaptatus sp. YSMS36]|uniref:hypothetical protein n=1 Tax=Haladaptatus sp. YSMS36 TaxID=3033384 RepID=UPI0023E793CF|nr:hypothetical protein [Haladaptatus sp. YSMS36]
MAGNIIDDIVRTNVHIPHNAHIGHQTVQNDYIQLEICGIMGIGPSNRIGEANSDQDDFGHPRLDPETVNRIEYALNGTVDVDVSKLSSDDKLTLLIERYNRKLRELQQLKSEEL